MRESIERFRLRNAERQVDGELRLSDEVYSFFRDAPYDMLDGFRPPPGRERKPAQGRGKDHPRYGRFVYALARALRPEIVVEVGTYAGGTGIGWCSAIRDSGRGRLICVDNDSYSKGTYPTIARQNLQATGVDLERVEMRCGDSRELIPELAVELQGAVDIYLVDADHTFEGATADIENGLPMVRPGGWVLVHDVERERTMAEETPQHPHPVYEAFMNTVNANAYEWCILRFIRKHLGVFRV